MKGFDGQLTCLGLQGTQASVWQLVPFYIKAFQYTKTRFIGFFKVLVE